MNRVESALQDMASLDDLARRTTWTHQLDPRVKILVTLLFVVIVASFPRRAVVELLPCAAYPLVMFIAAGLPTRILRKPLGIALSLTVLIAAANPWLDQELVRLGPNTVISAGWFSFVSLLLRSALCVAAATALVATTGVERLCHALSRMGVPRGVVTQVLFLYRYAFLLGSNALAMSRARDLRCCGRSLRLSTYGPLVGHLLLRTLDRAERIHQAMRCRGFRGELPIPQALRLRAGDLAFLLGWCSGLLVLRWYLPADRLGALFLGTVL